MTEDGEPQCGAPIRIKNSRGLHSCREKEGREGGEEVEGERKTIGGEGQVKGKEEGKGKEKERPIRSY